MSTKNSNKKISAKSSSHKEKMSFNLVIRTNTQIALIKGVILGLIITAMVILAYYKIFEPIVWSSLVTIAGYVAFSNGKTKSNP